MKPTLLTGGKFYDLSLEVILFCLAISLIEKFAGVHQLWSQLETRSIKKWQMQLKILLDHGVASFLRGVFYKHVCFCIRTSNVHA